MYKLVFTFIFLITSFTDANAHCRQNIVGASYKMTTVNKQNLQIDNKPEIDKMILWRYNDQVAHEYYYSQITEIWKKQSNDQIRLSKLFDGHKRGIEYEPNEIPFSDRDNFWQKKKFLVSDHLIKKMQLTGSKKSGCDTEQILAQSEKNQNIHLIWLPRQKLVKSFKVVTQNKTIYWQLQNIITDIKQVEQFFASRSGYDMTDYTDIGDNESDPFLKKMIHLGFVSHGASGFYDQNGHDIGGGHLH